MASKNFAQTSSKSEKQFLDTFNSLCYSRNSWQVWADFITAAACSLANAVDTKGTIHDNREKEYKKCVERLGGVENAVKLFSCVIADLKKNPEQDFLDKLFMELNLSNHWKRQFLTPYYACRTMAATIISGVENAIADKGWSSINDPACGAGATLIAAANVLREHNIDYQNKALFVAQDIDRISGLMCYIQLSLLGCAGYIVIANTPCNPTSGKSVLFRYDKYIQIYKNLIYLYCNVSI